jgi:hypothetical protein
MQASGPAAPQSRNCSCPAARAPVEVLIVLLAAARPDVEPAVEARILKVVMAPRVGSGSGMSPSQVAATSGMNELRSDAETLVPRQGFVTGAGKVRLYAGEQCDTRHSVRCSVHRNFTWPYGTR